MATTYPSTKQTFTNPAGTQTLDSPDHAGLHSDNNDTIEAIEDTLGTTAGTSVLKHFAAGEFPVRATGIAAVGTLKQTIVGGTHNNTIIGTSAITGGTMNSATFGTPTIAGTWVAPAGLVVTADIKDSNITTAKIADANVTGRKMKIDQTFGTSITTVGTYSGTSTILAGTFTPNVTSNLLVLVNTNSYGNSVNSAVSYVVLFNGTNQGTVSGWEQPGGAVANITYSMGGYAFVQSAPASAGTVGLRIEVALGSVIIKSVSFQVLPFAA